MLDNNERKEPNKMDMLAKELDALFGVKENLNKSLQVALAHVQQYYKRQQEKKLSAVKYEALESEFAGVVDAIGDLKTNHITLEEANQKVDSLFASRKKDVLLNSIVPAIGVLLRAAAAVALCVAAVTACIALAPTSPFMAVLVTGAYTFLAGLFTEGCIVRASTIVDSFTTISNERAKERTLLSFFAPKTTAPVVEEAAADITVQLVAAV